MSLNQACVASVLAEYEAGYIFTPFGAYGKAYLVARSSSRSLVSILSVLCLSVWPVLGAIVISGVYSRITHTAAPFLIAAMVGVAWICAFASWAVIATRGLIEVPRNAR